LVNLSKISWFAIFLKPPFSVKTGFPVQYLWAYNAHGIPIDKEDIAQAHVQAPLGKKSVCMGFLLILQALRLCHWAQGCLRIIY